MVSSSSTDSGIKCLYFRWHQCQDKVTPIQESYMWLKMPQKFLINEVHKHKYIYMYIYAGRCTPYELYIDPNLLFQILREWWNSAISLRLENGNIKCSLDCYKYNLDSPHGNPKYLVQRNNPKIISKHFCVFKIQLPGSVPWNFQGKFWAGLSFWSKFSLNQRGKFHNAVLCYLILPLEKNQSPVLSGYCSWKAQQSLLFTHLLGMPSIPH